MHHNNCCAAPRFGPALSATAAVTVVLLGAAACGSSATNAAKPVATAAAPSARPSTAPAPSAAKTTPPVTTSAAPSRAVTSVAGSATPPPATALVTVPPVPVRTQRAVPPQSTGDFGGGVTVKITKIASVTSAGSGPGEIAGAPSVALTIALTNRTGSPVSLDAVALTATYGSAQTPASPSGGPPSVPFSGSVAPQRAASGTYVFEIPAAQRGDVTVSMSYTASKPTVLFHGSVAG